MCGIEAIYLAMKLQAELLRDYVMTQHGTMSGPYIIGQNEERDKKVKELELIVKKCAIK